MNDARSTPPALHRLHELVSDHPDFEVLRGSTISGYCFRYLPNTLADRRDEADVQSLLDDLNQQIVAAVQRHRQPLVTTIRIQDRVVIRMRAVSIATSTDEIDGTFEALARWGRLIHKKLTVQSGSTADMEAQLCLSELHSSSTELSAI